MFAMPTRLSQESLLVCPLMKRLKALSEMPMASANAACVMLRSRSKSLILSRGLPGVPGKYVCIWSASPRYLLTFIYRTARKILRWDLHFCK